MDEAFLAVFNMILAISNLIFYFLTYNAHYLTVAAVCFICSILMGKFK